jgi:hypothetical protein
VNTARLRVVLRGVEPAVARVIDVPASATLPELHELLQAAIGWTDSHLHQFVTPQETYGMEIPGAEVWPEDQRDETGALLADLGTEFEYLYDFGDGWTHDIEVPNRPRTRSSRCTASPSRRPGTSATRSTASTPAWARWSSTAAPDSPCAPRRGS